MDYCATQKYSKIHNHASDTTLRIHSDASNLSEIYARSRARGTFSYDQNISKTSRKLMEPYLHSPT